MGARDAAHGNAGAHSIGYRRAANKPAATIAAPLPRTATFAAAFLVLVAAGAVPLSVPLSVAAAEALEAWLVALDAELEVEGLESPTWALLGSRVPQLFWISFLHLSWAIFSPPLLEMQSW